MFPKYIYNCLDTHFFTNAMYNVHIWLDILLQVESFAVIHSYRFEKSVRTVYLHRKKDTYTSPCKYIISTWFQAMYFYKYSTMLTKYLVVSCHDEIISIAKSCESKANLVLVCLRGMLWDRSCFQMSHYHLWKEQHFENVLKLHFELCRTTTVYR